MVSRRAFTLLAALAGLGALLPRRALAEGIGALAPAAAARREPLLAALEALVGRFDRGEISAEQFVADVQARLAATDLPAALADYLDPAAGGERIDVVWHDTVDNQARALMLFFIPPGHAHPPHAHHQVASTQCVVRGTVRVRQYARVARLDPHTLTLRPVRDRTLTPYGAILATEQLDNVHWFGAETEPAIVLNYSLNGGIRDTFDAPRTRGVGRYYLDPTGAVRDGVIVAPQISEEAARARFASQPLSAFASLG
ncbi:MAG: hypothetical protein ABI629_09500 [bacterium]